MRILVLCTVLAGACLPVIADEPVAAPVLASAQTQPQAPYQNKYQGQIVVRVAPATPEQLARVEALAEGIWSERIGLGPIEIQIRKDRLAQLVALGLSPVILIDDLQASVDREFAQIQKVRAAELAQPNNPLFVRAGNAPHNIRFWDSFKNRAQIEGYLFALATAYPDMATLQQIGSSVNGSPIWAILISAPDSPSNPRAQRSVVQFNGTQHAREWISPMTVLYLADQLLAQSASTPRVAGLLETTEFAIVPITNPDGYDYTWTTDRFWRKNRRNNADGTFGVDLNRNWSFQWGGSGSSGIPSSNIYRGTSPLSEPETAAVSNLTLSFGNRFAGAIDYHSYSQLILWPWGFSAQFVLPEPDRTIITNLSFDMAGTINAMSGRSYIAEKATDLYPADGTADDWFQGATPGFGITIELRTTNQFNPPREHIQACAVENFASALQYAEGVSQTLRIEPTTALPAAAAPGTPLTIEARILSAMSTLDPAMPTLHVLYPNSTAEVDLPMASTGPATYAASITPPSTRGRVRVRVSAATTSGSVLSFPAVGYSEITILSSATQTLFADDFETDAGWVIGSPDDDATAGLWQRGNPSLDPNHPPADTTPGGSNCFVTGLSPNDDVDTGYTRLVSPKITLPARPGDILISADLWRRVNTTEPMLIELAPDGTDAWTPALKYWPQAATWQRHTLRVNDFISPASSFRVRFSAADLPGDTTTEMAVDGVQIVLAPAPSRADLNGDGVVDNGDIAVFIGLFLAGDLRVDFNGDGIIDSGDISGFLSTYLLG